MRITFGMSAWALPALFMRVPTVPVTHVVVGVDGSAGSVAAVEWAAGEARRRRAGLRIVSAWQKQAGRALADAGDPARMAAAQVEKAVARVLSLHDSPPYITGAAAQGSPGEVLLSEAGESGLLVLGAYTDNIAQALGSTGRHCLRRGRGPLVFVPARAPHGDRPSDSQSGLYAGDTRTPSAW
jgi:nucleotide-binding universal stress UspA family protein